MEAPSLEASANDNTSLTLSELKDIFGDELLSDVSMRALGSMGLLDGEGFPMAAREWGDRGLYRLSFADMFDAVPNLSLDDGNHSELRKLAIDDAVGKDAQEVAIHFGAYDLSRRIYNDNSGRYTVSADCCEACLDDSLTEYIDRTYYGYDSDDRYLDDIPESARDELERKGFPRDCLESVFSGDDDGIPFKEELRSAFDTAVYDGCCEGLYEEISGAFDNAMRDALYTLCGDGASCSADYDRGGYTLTVSRAWVESNLTRILEDAGWSSGIGMRNLLQDFLYNGLSANLAEEFNEPYYGFSGFSEEAFASTLLDCLKTEVPDASEAQNDGEVSESAELIKAEPARKPERIFYRYADENRELSRKAYRLGTLGLLAVMEFLRSSDRPTRYVSDSSDIDMMQRMLNDGDEGKVIISPLKPSYAADFGQDAYTLWADRDLDGSYETSYIGWVPKHVGDEAIGRLGEEFSLEVVPVPDITVDPDYYFDGIDDIIADSIDKDCWSVWKRADGNVPDSWGDTETTFEPLHTGLGVNDALSKFREEVASPSNEGSYIILSVGGYIAPGKIVREYDIHEEPCVGKR